MSETFLRQSTQIRSSDNYDDTSAAGSPLETAPENLEADLNSLRSQLQNFSGETNWYDAPAATLSALAAQNVNLVEVSANDATPGNLEAKIVAGAGISLTTLNDGANEQIEISAPGTGTDELVGVSADDTTPGYLEQKIVAGTNISLTTLSPAGDEDLQISLTGTQAGFDSTAIHDDTAGEIAAVAAKAAPTGSDLLLIEDAAATNAKKSITLGSVDHGLLTNTGTNTHAQIDSHLADGTLHFTEASIDHTAILNIGTNSHAQIDTHIAAAAIHIDWTAPGAGTIDTSNYIEGGPGTDTTAIHDNVAGEISAIVAKAAPIGGDFLLIEDSAAANAKKRITLGDIDHDQLTNFVVNEHIDWTAASAGTIDPTNYVDNDELVGVSADDTTPGYLEQKIVAGTNIAIATLNGAADEDLQISVTGTQAGFDSTAVHTDTAGEINALTFVPPQSGDYLLIEDASDGFAKKKVSISSLPSPAVTEWEGELISIYGFHSAKATFGPIFNTLAETAGTESGYIIWGNWPEPSEILFLVDLITGGTGGDQIRLYDLSNAAAVATATIPAPTGNQVISAGLSSLPAPGDICRIEVLSDDPSLYVRSMFIVFG